MLSSMLSVKPVLGGGGVCVWGGGGREGSGVGGSEERMHPTEW